MALYPDDDLEVWKKHHNIIPETSINGYDKDGIIRTQLVYDLKAIPTIYLLDKDKKIFFKDTDITTIERYIAGTN